MATLRALMATPVNPLAALFLARCPRCRTGGIFRPHFPNAVCAVCGLAFRGERGYQSGAWAISFFVGFPVIFALTLFLSMRVVPDWPLERVVLPAILLFALFVPLVWLSSFVLLIHLDDRWRTKS